MSDMDYYADYPDKEITVYLGTEEIYTSRT